MGFLHSRSQVGYPPTMHNGAYPEYSCLGYQGAEIGMAKCDAGRFILARLEGTAPKGHDATKKEICSKSQSGLLSVLYACDPVAKSG